MDYLKVDKTVFVQVVVRVSELVAYLVYLWADD